MKDNKPYVVNGERVSHDDYVKTKYEDLRIRVIKGRKDEILAAAQASGHSLNNYVNKAIDEKIERDNGSKELNQKTH